VTVDDVQRIFVCQGFFCSARGSYRLLAEFQARFAGDETVRVEPYYCFNGCSHGPNVVFYPARVWYEGVRSDDVSAIAAHAATGEPAGRECGRRIPAIVKETGFEALNRKCDPGSDARRTPGPSWPGFPSNR
jgi:(2Fe-2S) ferredoxin